MPLSSLFGGISYFALTVFLEDTRCSRTSGFGEFVASRLRGAPDVVNLWRAEGRFSGNNIPGGPAATKGRGAVLQLESEESSRNETQDEQLPLATTVGAT
jgi:hypothetical protein